MEYLEFELPIKELEEQLDKCQIIGKESDVDVTETCKQIEKKSLKLKKKSIKTLRHGSVFNCLGILIGLIL
jgi:acetyl-CoA carboxylase carboxyl transferase subunit alpha